MFIIVYKIYYCNFIYVFRDEYESLNWWGEWILNISNIFDVCDNCNEMVWVSFVDSLLGLVNYYNFY